MGRKATKKAPRRIRLPEIHRPLLSAREDRLSLEYAALDCRAPETFLALALRERGNVVFYTTTPERVRFAIREWFPEMPIERFTGAGVTGFTIGRTTLWVAPADATGSRGFLEGRGPFPVADALYVTGADRIGEDPVSLLGSRLTGRAWIAGEFAEGDHWSYRFGREEGVSLVRLAAPEIAAAFPDQADAVLNERDPRYPRLMALEDEPIRLPVFRVFARKRLRLRTDKPPEAMTPKQAAEAERQLGKNWHRRGSGSPLVPFEPLPLQRRYLAMKRRAKAMGKPFVLLLKYRRGGFTTLEQAESYMIAATRPRSSVTTLSYSGDSTKRIFRMVTLYQEQDPESPPLVNDSKSELAFANGSFFFIGTAGAKGFARGDTLQRFHGSEVSRWLQGPHQMDQVDDLVAGLRGAASHGEGVLETTPAGVEWFCTAYRDAKAGINDWYPAFLPWFMDPINVAPLGTYDPEEIVETISEEEGELIDRHGLTVPQIAFRRAQVKVYRRLFPQEYPEDDETCFLASGYAFFDPGIIVDLVRRTEDPPIEHLPGGGRWTAARPIKGRRYVIGVDTSEGLPGCDPCGAGVLDWESGEQVAWIHGLFRPAVLAGLVVDLAREYNEALVGVERQNHGHAVLQRIRDLGYDRPHYRGGKLFYCGRSKDQDKAKPGWSTDTRTRPIMLDDLSEAIEEGSIRVRDRAFLSECRTFRLQSGGKFEADSGAHDDSVMKWAIAWQMRNVRLAKPDFMPIRNPLGTG